MATGGGAPVGVRAPLTDTLGEYFHPFRNVDLVIDGFQTILLRNWTYFELSEDRTEAFALLCELVLDLLDAPLSAQQASPLLRQLLTWCNTALAGPHGDAYELALQTVAECLSRFLPRQPLAFLERDALLHGLVTHATGPPAIEAGFFPTLPVLIPFPVESLFTKELKNFDLVIFDNFFYRPYLNPNDLESIKEFVREGGSFAIIGGPNFFGEGGYIETPIEELLPVRFSGKEDYRREPVVGVKLSRLGTTHPITRFSSDGNSPQNLWEEMPPLDGINLLEPKSSGGVLLESADGTSKPILTVGNYGKGRVLILGTDFSWKWYMGMLAQGKGPGRGMDLGAPGPWHEADVRDRK